MARFYEQYGHAIGWSLISLLGIGSFYWLLVAVAQYSHLLPIWANLSILAVHDAVSFVVREAMRFVEQRIQWLGALATLATFVVGLVTGIRQAKRHLPRRLVQFMTEQLAPVYNNSEAVVSAVAYRSAGVPHKAPLFHKAPLDRALNALGDPFRPRRRRSLDEAIAEADTHIRVTEKRLAYLNDIRAHAQILRGAVRSAEGAPGAEPDAADRDAKVEADFTEAIGNEAKRMSGLELRGLLRARLGNLPGALHDFAQLEARAKEVFCTRGHARALRHQADVLKRQAAGRNARLLRQARRSLNIANQLFDDGRTLGGEDWLERGHNRECYGEVQTSIASIAGTGNNAALSAFNEAIDYFQRSGMADDSQRVRDRIPRL